MIQNALKPRSFAFRRVDFWLHAMHGGSFLAGMRMVRCVWILDDLKPLQTFAKIPTSLLPSPTFKSTLVTKCWFLSLMSYQDAAVSEELRVFG